MANGVWLIAGPKGKARRPEKVCLVCLPSFFGASPFSRKKSRSVWELLNQKS